MVDRRWLMDGIRDCTSSNVNVKSGQLWVCSWEWERCGESARVTGKAMGEGGGKGGYQTYAQEHTDTHTRTHKYPQTQTHHGFISHQGISIAIAMAIARDELLDHG